MPLPADREPGVIYLHALYSREAYARADAVEVAGVRFARRGECAMTRTFRGTPCSDWTCSACGKVHNAPRANEFCPRCGAEVVEVVA